MAFVQHMVASLSEAGRLAVVLPNGALTRRRNEEAVRRDLVDGDVVEAVIQLPKDMFYGAGIPACFLVVNRAKDASRRGRVLFVDASSCFARVETKNVLQSNHIDEIIAAFHDPEPRDGFSAWVATEEIARWRYSLGARRYVGGGSSEIDVASLPDAIEALEAARRDRAAAEVALDELLTELRQPNGER